MNNRVRDINDFMSIVKSNNGKIKVTHSIDNATNIYEFLKDNGFCKYKIDHKRVYYRRVNGDIIPIRLFDIKNYFLSSLRNLEFINIPDIPYCDIMNWYHHKDPIKQNKLDVHIESPLTSDEEHIYKLKSDIDYKQKIEKEQMLVFLRDNTFSNFVDVKGIVCTNAILYYKKIEDAQYLIFAHFNHDKKKWKDGFDSYLATYSTNSLSHIEKQAPLSLETIKFSFSLNNDLELIQKYLNLE